jgi:hypothetical protein
MELPTIETEQTQGSLHEAGGRSRRRHPRPHRPGGGGALRRIRRQRVRRQPGARRCAAGLVLVAFQAGAATGIDPNVLLAIAKIETDWGQARNGQPDDLVPADIRASVSVTELLPGGATISLLDLAGGRRIGDWVNPQPVGHVAGERAVTSSAVVWSAGHARRRTWS